MYQSPYNPDYIIPDLLKYQCLDESCEKQFILSEAYDNSKVKCPYCGSSSVEAIVAMVDPEKLSELGCMAISTSFNEAYQKWLKDKMR
jgi:PHP family Zn ribbon phosphoesterase